MKKMKCVKKLENVFFFFVRRFHSKKKEKIMLRLSLIVALFACALLTLGDASATSAASSTAVSTLPPAGEVVELTVRGRGRKERNEFSIDRWSIKSRFFLSTSSSSSISSCSFLPNSHATTTTTTKNAGRQL